MYPSTTTTRQHSLREISNNKILLQPNLTYDWSNMVFKLNSITCVGPGVFVVEYLATQTVGATVNNIFEVRFTYTKMV